MSTIFETLLLKPEDTEIVGPALEELVNCATADEALEAVEDTQVRVRNAQMHECSHAQMLNCSNAQMLKCTTA